MQLPIPAGGRELRRGDIVRIKSAPEILATLDAAGRLDGMPFMPEMLQHCGRSARVHRRADKTCDTIGPGEHRRLRRTVHLEGLRCGGEAHGGCQAACLMFWNEAWLERMPDLDGDPSAENAAGTAAVDSRPRGAANFTHDDLLAASRTNGRLPGEEPVYACQATELVRASTRMPWWDVRQYLRDVRSGNVGTVEVLLGIGRWLFVAVQQRLTGSTVPFVHGRLADTPREVIGLRAGDRVRVRTKEEIERTLDTRNRTRGLSFDSEMLRYCGQETRVLQRVTRIIDERTGRMRILQSDCLILDDAICTSAYHLFCPRSIYPFWREAWLTRVEGDDQDSDGAVANSGERSVGWSA